MNFNSRFFSFIGFFLFCALYSQHSEADFFSLFNSKEDTLIYKKIERRMNKNLSENDYMNIRAIPFVLRLNPVLQKNIRRKFFMIANIGTSYKNLMKYDSSNHYLTLALNGFKSISDTAGMAFVYNALGVMEKNRGNYPGSLEYYFTGLKLTPAKNSRQIGQFYLNIAILYKNMKEFHNALSYYHKADSVYQLMKDTVNLIRTLLNTSNLYRDFGRMGEAIKYSVLAYQLMMRSSVRDVKMCSNVTIDYAWTRIQMKEYATALRILTEIENRLLQMHLEHNLFDLYLYKMLAYDELGDFNHSALYEKKFLEIAEKKINFGEVISGYKTIMNIKLRRKNYREAFQYSEKIRLLSEKIYSEELLKKSARAEEILKADIRNKTLEILSHKQTIQELEIKRQRLFLGAMALVLMLSVMAAWVFRKNYKKIKQFSVELQHKNELIQAQNKTIEEKNKNITDSMAYAYLIQKNILPDEKRFTGVFSGHFIFYLPRDIVSGDFYFLEKKVILFIWL